MTTLTIPNRKITADAIARKWPGAIVSCRVNKADGSTDVTFEKGSPVPVKTAAEIIAAQDEHDPMEAWERQMAETDRTMPRYVEDVIDTLLANGTIIVTDMPQITQDNFNNKKALRVTKPVA